MAFQAYETLARHGAATKGHMQMLPDIEHLKDVNFEIAVNVAKQALADGVTSLDPKTDIEALVRSCQWTPDL